MDPVIGGAAIGAGAKLLGGIFSGLTGNSSQRREYERQKEFAQNAIQWKVADAKKAGLHPLYALGAQTASYSPQSAIGTDYGLSDIGQGITDFAAKYKTPAERAHEKWYNKTTELLNLRNMELQNDLISQQIRESEARIEKQPGNPIGMSVPSGGKFSKTMGIPSQPMVEIKPNEITAGAPDQRESEVGENRDIMYVMDEHGNLSFYPTEKTSDYVSNTTWNDLIWKARAMLTKPGRSHWHPKAIDYRLNIPLQRWEPVFESGRQFKYPGNHFAGGSAW